MSFGFKGLTQSWLNFFSTPQSKTQETLIEAISINYELLPESSLDICFNKLITNLGLPMFLIHCDCETVRDTPENILLHTKLENHTLSIRHLSLDLSTNVTNPKARNLKSFRDYIEKTGVSFS
jgi:hypothetical protein